MTTPQGPTSAPGAGPDADGVSALGDEADQAPAPSRSGRSGARVAFWVTSLLALLASLALAQVTYIPSRLRAPAGWHADLLLVLTGDPGARRVARGTELLLEGRAPRMLISGDGAGEDSAYHLAAWAAAHGAPPDRIVLEPRSLNTWENMRFSRPVIRALGARSVLLVTSRAHARRAVLVAERVFDGVEVRVEPVEAGDTALLGRARELAKTLRYALLGHLSAWQLLALR